MARWRTKTNNKVGKSMKRRGSVLFDVLLASIVYLYSYCVEN